MKHEATHSILALLAALGLLAGCPSTNDDDSAANDDDSASDDDDSVGDDDDSVSDDDDSVGDDDDDSVGDDDDSTPAPDVVTFVQGDSAAYEVSNIQVGPQSVTFDGYYEPVGQPGPPSQVTVTVQFPSDGWTEAPPIVCGDTTTVEGYWDADSFSPWATDEGTPCEVVAGSVTSDRAAFEVEAWLRSGSAVSLREVSISIDVARP